MSSSVRPQLSQTIRIPAARAAGIANRRSWFLALFPAPSEGLPSAVDKKKFCISIITRAVSEGDITIGVVLVLKVIDDDGDEMG